ncbi:murein L,D-transpeptidase [Rhodobacteraceae bacterium RKSG542]|uniref:L,D-transpeptidase family protein n=1 Tax=Pseudovibrio flavus TaxID=2529854 RepID=UPI0012BBAE48|nr:murein L,D-transpeptidase family protein [Pseudovibrio flavus]MTI18306.1 murein L,D-transpeptidase [Pseudovibrio flavus]
MLSNILSGLKQVTKPLSMAAIALTLVACQGADFADEKHRKPVSKKVQRKIETSDMALKAPIFIRIFKEESELEVWKQTKSGQYALLETYEICKWSGKLGPKFKEGDRQAPEGFYFVTPGRMNPNSDYYLSFNLGFPNRYDRAHDRTGTHLMVHGACSSAGCYAMTDDSISDIYALARDSFMGGQREFQVHAFPFRMTGENMARHAENEHFEFWEMLKEGYDHFAVTKQPPKIDVCDRRYVFNAEPTIRGAQFSSRNRCPDYSIPQSISVALAKKQAEDQKNFEEFQIAAEKSRQRQEQLAAFFGTNAADKGGPAQTTAETVAEAAPANTPSQSQLALTPETKPEEAPKTEKDRAFGYFSKIFPIGQKEEAVAIVDENIPLPISKP